MEPDATEMSQEAESRIEMLCPTGALEAVADAIRRASPYGADATIQAWPVRVL